MWAIAAKTILRNRLVLLLLLGGITAFMIYEAIHIQLSYEFARVLPDNDPDYLDYLHFKESFGEDGAVMVVGVQDNDFYQLKKFNDWYDLNNEIKNINGIEEVVSESRMFHLIRNDSLLRFDVKPLIVSKPNSQNELDSLKSEMNQLPFYEGLVYNKTTGAHLMA